MRKSWIAAGMASLFLLPLGTAGAQTLEEQNQSYSAAQTFDIVSAKKALVEAHKNPSAELSSSAERAQKNDEVESVLNELMAHGASQDEIDRVMESHQVFRLDIPNPDSEIMVPFSQGSDIQMNNVSIYYNSGTKNWHVSSGGFWKNDNWFNDYNGGLFGNPGQSANIGGPDTFGITLYNTRGTYNTRVISSTGYWTDQEGTSVTSSTPSHGDGKLGVAFDFQDTVTLKSWSGFIRPADLKYLGKGFSATITYDSNFSNYHGYARSFYGHTWNSTSISSVAFGTGSYGVNINFSSTANKFSAYNNSETMF